MQVHENFFYKKSVKYMHFGATDLRKKTTMMLHADGSQNQRGLAYKAL